MIAISVPTTHIFTTRQHVNEMTRPLICADYTSIIDISKRKDNHTLTKFVANSPRLLTGARILIDAQFLRPPAMILGACYDVDTLINDNHTTHAVID